MCCSRHSERYLHLRLADEGAICNLVQARLLENGGDQRPGNCPDNRSFHATLFALSVCDKGLAMSFICSSLEPAREYVNPSVRLEGECLPTHHVRLNRYRSDSRQIFSAS